MTVFTLNLTNRTDSSLCALLVTLLEDEAANAQMLAHVRQELRNRGIVSAL